MQDLKILGPRFYAVFFLLERGLLRDLKSYFMFGSKMRVILLSSIKNPRVISAYK